jgi:hypothetical protein
MLSPQGMCPLMSSRSIGMSSQGVRTHFKRDEPEPDYRVNVEYLGRLEIAVSGTTTGRLYRFTPVQRVQQVDPRDAFYLLASGLFGVAS